MLDASRGSNAKRALKKRNDKAQKDPRAVAQVGKGESAGTLRGAAAAQLLAAGAGLMSSGGAAQPIAGWD